MIEIGKYNLLRIDRQTDQGLYLESEDGEDVLLPNRYIPSTWKIDEQINVFVYNDSEDRMVATTLTPKIKLNEFALLEIKSISSFGAFADWGLAKDLLIPLNNQHRKLLSGENVVVYMYLDERTNRLVGTTKTSHLEKNPLTVHEGEEVDLLIGSSCDFGFNVIINSIHVGILFDNEIFQPIQTGNHLKGYIKKIRENGKIDVRLRKIGFENIDPFVQKILDTLVLNKGKLLLTDHSRPEEIVTQLEMSKKTFKKAIGNLYKQRKIRIEKDGIYLNT